MHPARSLLCVIALLVLLCSSAAGADKAPARLSVPDAAAQTSAQEEIKRVLSADYARLSKKDLARKLLSMGRGTEGSPTRRYVLFVEAGKAAVAAGDGALIVEAADAIATNFENSDADELKLKALERAAKTVPRETAEPLGTYLLTYSMTVAAAADFRTAQQLVEAAASIARRTKDNELLRRTRDKQKEITDLKREFTKASDAIDRLAKEPTDPDANLAAGKYYALALGDWDKGVPMLALGNDETLQVPAALDLAQPTEADAEIAVADKWWDLSAKATPARKTHLRERAAYWYCLALPVVKDTFLKARVQMKLAEAGKKVLSSSELDALSGEYQLYTQVTKSTEANIPVGRTESNRWLLLRSGGDAQEINPGNGKPYAGRWSAAGNQLVLCYADPGRGHAILTIGRRDSSSALEGMRTTPSGSAWLWRPVRGFRSGDSESSGLDGEYSVDTVVSKSVDSHFPVGKAEKYKLALRSNGDGELSNDTANRYQGTWTAEYGQLVFKLNGPAPDQVVFKISKNDSGVALAGVRTRGDGGEWTWKAARAAAPAAAAVGNDDAAKAASAVEGEYLCSTKLTKAADGRQYEVGKIDSRRLNLRPAGRMEVKTVEGATLGGTWTFDKSQITVKFDDPKYGQIQLSVLRKDNDMQLAGTRRTPNGVEWAWKGSRSAAAEPNEEHKLVVGQYELVTQVTKSPNPNNRIGSIETGHRLILREGGVGEQTFAAANRTWPGSWGIVDHQVFFTFKDPTNGQSILNITKTSNGVMLQGSHGGAQHGVEWAWRAKK